MDAETVALMPDEILIQIFHHLDTVTRIRIERVCQRWKSILTHTASFQKYVNVDLRYLTTEQRPDYCPSDYEACWRLFRTVQLILSENSLVETLHIKSEVESGATGDAVDIKRDDNADEVSYYVLEPYKWEDEDVEMPPRIVLENLPVHASHLHHFIWLTGRQDYPRPFLGGRTSVLLELRNVKVVDLSLYCRVMDAFPRDERDRAVIRHVSYRLVCGDDLAGNYAICLEDIQDHEPALTVEEESEYLAVVSAMDTARLEPAKELYRVLHDVFCKRVSLAEILDGSGLTSLEKRVIVAGRYTLDRWDVEARALETCQDMCSEQAETVVIDDDKVAEVIVVNEDDAVIAVD